MAGVSFVDSSGLSVLVTSLKAARAKGGDLVLASLTPPVRSIVELTRLHRILSTAMNAKEGVEVLSR